MINVLMSRGIIDKEFMYEQLKDIIKPNHKVCVLSFSFFDFHIENENDWNLWYQKDEGFYYQKMVEAFSLYKIPASQISFLKYYSDSREQLIKKINESDILYIPGGAPDQMYNRIVEKDILETLEKYDKIIIGSSAGAMIQFNQYHISKDREYHKFSINKGLGYINNFGVEVHFRPTKQQKKGIRKVSNIINRPVYQIPDDSAIIINDGYIKLINNAKIYYKDKKKFK